MSDRYQQFVNSAIGKQLQPRLGLPAVEPLRRFKPGQPLADGAVLVGEAAGGTAATEVLKVLAAAGTETWTGEEGDLRTRAADAGLTAKIWAPGAGGDQKFYGLIFDATGIENAQQLEALYEFFHPVARSTRPSGRIIVIGRTPELCESASARVAQRALEGFTRSCGKEFKRGVTAQLVYVAPGAESQLESTVRFLVSSRSAFVSGQVIRVGASVVGKTAPEVDWDKPLAGKNALVTGASRGIGEAIAEVLARDGANVTVLDIPPLADNLRKVASRIGGSAIEADVTDPELPAKLAEEFKGKGGLDIIVNNAGVTRDKMLANMGRDRWDMVMNINLIAVENITNELIAKKVFNKNGRVIDVASIAGIGGNLGQTNYGASKAGVIGLVQAYNEEYAKAGITINAVAPGFIETQMTAAIPMMIREPARRMSSLGQGGLPVDVAETIAWYASAGSTGVTGNVIRVCGQHLMGA